MRLGALVATIAVLACGIAEAQGSCGPYKKAIEGAANGFAGLRGAPLKKDVYESTDSFAGSRPTDCIVDAAAVPALHSCTPFYTKEEAARSVYGYVLSDTRACFTDARALPMPAFPAGSKYSVLEGFIFELPSGPIKSIEVSVVKATYDEEPSTMYIVDRTLIAR